MFLIFTCFPSHSFIFGILFGMHKNSCSHSSTFSSSGFSPHLSFCCYCMRQVVEETGGRKYAAVTLVRTWDDIAAWRETLCRNALSAAGTGRAGIPTCRACAVVDCPSPPSSKLCYTTHPRFIPPCPHPYVFCITPFLLLPSSYTCGGNTLPHLPSWFGLT